MEKILSQNEIDALLRSARSGPQKKTDRQASPERATAFVFGQGGGITSQQLSAINLLHETFARNLTQRVSAHLRGMFEVTLVSAEQLPFTEFLQQIEDRSYLASIRTEPLNATALFELDLALAFPIIDLLLGGDGKVEPTTRDLTEIEELILQSVLQIIFEELQGVWENQVSMKFALEQRQQQSQVMRLLPSNERMFAISFETQVQGIRGTLTFGFPAAVSGALLRKLSEQSLVRKRQVASDYIAQRQRRVEECGFALEMKLPEIPVSAQQLAGLKVGETLVLQHAIEDPILITVANQKMFTGYPVRARNARGALIQTQMPVTAPSTQEIA
jgi:flagellar motor switch protein FliM